MRTALLAFALVSPVAAQEFLGERDFLTQLEVEEIREAQEPPVRIEKYLEFAALRVELIRQLMEKEEAGRGAKVHRNLDEYGRIIEAIDMVVDDALLRDIDVAESMEPLSVREEEFLEKLELIEDRDPDDLWRYQFVLMDAIEITNDSLDLIADGLDERKRAILDADDAEKAAREESMAPERRKEVAKVRQQQKAVEQKTESKRPSLLKQGESLEDFNTRPSNKGPRQKEK